MQTASKSWLAIASFVSAMLAVPGAAHAGFLAYICDDQLCTGGGDTIVADNGAGDNFPGSANLGQINAGAVSVNGFTIVTNVAMRSASSAPPQLDLTFTATTTDAMSHTVWLYASATDFTGPGGTYAMTLGGTQPLPGTANSVAGRAYGGNTNTNLGLANLLASLNSSATSFALSMNGAFVPGVNPYALTIGVVVTRNAAGATTGDLNFLVSPTVVGVPEPESLMLLTAGLVAFGVTRKRRSRVA